MNKVLLKFKRDLLGWEAYIKRMGHLLSLSVEDLPNQEFVLVARWRDGGELRQAYTATYVMGPFVSAPPLAQRPRMRVCYFRDEFIRSVLHARGV